MSEPAVVNVGHARTINERRIDELEAEVTSLRRLLAGTMWGRVLTGEVPCSDDQYRVLAEAAQGVDSSKKPLFNQVIAALDALRHTEEG